MLYFSDLYLLAFVPIAYIGFRIFLGIKNNIWKYWLILCSLIFLINWHYNALFFITISILINYFLCKSLTINRNKTLLFLGIIFNISYPLFFQHKEILNLLDYFNNESTHSLANLFVPLAITFYSFQQLYYLVNTYQKKLNAIGFVDYSLSVVFFPKLLLGPFYNLSNFISQVNYININRLKTKEISNINLAIVLIVMGYFKSVFMGTLLNSYSGIDANYLTLSNFTFLESWSLTFSYTLYFYFIFSGLCDICTGVLILFGFKPISNFDGPFKASNVLDFWSKWHVSLYVIFKDYYKILKNKFNNSSFLILFLFSAMGFWYGIGINFILWGVINGLLVHLYVYYKSKIISKKDSERSNFLMSLIKRIIVFITISSTFVLFYSDTWSIALIAAKGLLGFNGVAIPENYIVYMGPIYKLMNFIGIKFIDSNDMPLFYGLKQILALTISFFIVFCCPSSKKIKEYFEKNHNQNKNNLNMFNSSLGQFCISLFLSIVFIGSFIVMHNSYKYTNTTFYPLVNTVQRSIGCEEYCGKCYKGIANINQCKMNDEQYRKF